MFAIGCSCRKGRRLLAWFLSIKRPLLFNNPRFPDVEIARMWQFWEKRCMLGRWPCIRKMPVDPGDGPSLIRINCAAVGFAPWYLMGFAGEALTRPGAVQVMAPSWIPRNIKDALRSNVSFRRFNIHSNHQGGKITSIEWGLTAGWTRLILTIEHPTMFCVHILGVREDGCLEHLYRFKCGGPVRLCRVLDGSNSCVSSVLFSERALLFGDGSLRGLSPACALNARVCDPNIGRLNVLAAEGVLFMVGREGLYRLGNSHSPAQAEPGGLLCRLGGVDEFVGPACASAVSGGLFLLGSRPAKGEWLLIEYTPGKEACDTGTLEVVCRFASAGAPYTANDLLGLLEGGSIVLCRASGQEAISLFKRDGHGRYAASGSLVPAYPRRAIVHVQFVSERGRVRSVVAFHCNGLVSIWGGHPAIASLRPDVMPA